MRTSRVTPVQLVVLALIVIVLVVISLPFVQTKHWVGRTDLEIEFLVIDSMSAAPISGSTVAIHSDGGFYDERDDGDFSLLTDLDGKATRVCHNSMSFGTSGWNIDTWAIHLPCWTYQVSAPGYHTTERTPLDIEENLQSVRRGKPAKLLVWVELQKQTAK